MVPILFSANETAFTSNGLGRLSEATRCEVTEERNGPYTLSMDYPVEGKLFPQIATGMYIYTTPNDSKVPQAFRIYNIAEPLEGLVTIEAEHISYALNYIVVGPFSAVSASDTMSKIPGACINPCPFTFWTDKAVTANFSNTIPKSVRNLLGGTSGSVLDVYGKGEYEWDMYTVKLHLNRGANRGVSIRYGKNLLSLDRQRNAAEVYNAVAPYWASVDGTEIVQLDHLVVRAGATAENAIALDMSSSFDAAPTTAELEAAAQRYIDASTAYEVRENISLDFVALWDTEEYKNMASLQRVRLCDTVNIFYEKRGINATAKVIKTVYDSLLERYVSLELGEPKTTLGQQINQMVTGTVRQEAPSVAAMQAAIDKATALITGNLGGYAIWHYNSDGTPRELLFMDTADEGTAQKVLRINNVGIGFSTTGVAGPYTTAWTIDGAFNADFITAGTLNANRIATGSIAGDKLAQSVQDDIQQGIDDAAAAQATANGANLQEQTIYKSAASGTSSMSGTTTWVTDTTGGQNVWTTVRPVYSQNYPVLFVATQRRTVSGTVTCTTPYIDQTTTVIDGGSIITGTLLASAIFGGTLTLGGANNQNGILQILDSSGNVVGTWDKDGVTVNNGIIQIPYSVPGTWTGTGTITLNPDKALEIAGTATDGKKYSTTARMGGFGTSIEGSGYSNLGWLTLVISKDSSSQSTDTPSITLVDYQNTRVPRGLYKTNEMRLTYLDNGETIFKADSNGIQIGSTSLSEAQLQQLLALI